MFDLPFMAMGLLFAYTTLLHVLVGQASGFYSQEDPPPTSTPTVDLEQERVAAITVAVHAYRSVRADRHP
ncbi:MAG: hypothetical protein H7837_10140 [Magnetococcus sp. MYC-9]